MKVVTPENKTRVSKDVFKKAYDFVTEHFFYVYPETLSPTPQTIKAKFLELIITKKVTGVILDPFNQLTNDYGKFNGRDDKYLESALGDFSRFAKENSVFFNVIAHPTKMQKDKDDQFIVPNLYSISGSAHFFNTADNGMTIYRRPQGEGVQDRTEIHIQKVRYKWVGKPGLAEFEWNKETGTYRETF